MEIQKDILNQLLAQPLGEGAYRIVETLFDQNIDAWWVGGPVRDLLLDILPHDIDIATSAVPEEIAGIFRKFTVKQAELGTCAVTVNNISYDVTTFRTEGRHTNGRRPDSVQFTSIEQDARRRDFTVNAMYFHPITRELYDPFHGSQDLHERLVRIIGNPVERVQEDPLRLLRAVRFKAQLNGQYEPATFQALHSQAALATSLSGSLVLQEIKKILNSGQAAAAFEDLWETDILEYLIPELHRCKGIPQPKDYHHEGDVWAHTMQCLNALRDDDPLAVRLGILFHDIGKAETFSVSDRIHFDEHASKSGDIAQLILRRMQCPRTLRDKVDWLVRHHMMMQDFFRMNNKRKGTWYHHEWFPDLMRIFWLDIAGTDPSNFSLYQRIDDDYHQFLNQFPKPMKLLLTGDDVQELTGLPGGKRVGEILDKLSEAQHDGLIQNKTDAISFVRQLELQDG